MVGWARTEHCYDKNDRTVCEITGQDKAAWAGSVLGLSATSNSNFLFKILKPTLTSGIYVHSETYGRH